MRQVIPIHPIRAGLTPRHLQLATFKAIQRADHASLRTLAGASARIGNDPVVLLCLDHVFSSPLALPGLPLTEIQTSLSLYLDYIRLLNKFRRDKSLAEDSDCQRIFGFQVLGEDRYLVPERTLLHEELTNRPGSNRKSTEGYKCGYDELSQGIVRLISSRIHNRTEIQNSACREVHGFSPCLHLLVQKRCNPPKEKGLCTFQHIRLEQISVDWYHARLRLILLQFQILDSARYYDRYVTKYAPVRSLGNTCGYSLNVKLLARGVILSTPPALSTTRILRES